MDRDNELIARRTARAEVLRRVQREIEDVLSRAGRAFDEKKYLEASEIYVYAVTDYWPQPVFTTRLAACYNALGRYFEAEEVATYALEYEPKSIEARYIRAMSRKGLCWFNAALKDLESILEQCPGNECAEAEMENIFTLMTEDEGFSMLDEGEEEHPRYTGTGWDLPDPESDSEDAHHEVGAAPCKSHNSGESHLIRECPFSHAPDGASTRDEMGRNVCNEFIIGDCAKGSTCAYSHSREYLPVNGWWNDPEALAHARGIKRELYHGYSRGGKRPALLKNPKGSPYVARNLAEETTEHIQETFENVDGRDHTATIRAPPDEPFILFISQAMYDPYGASLRAKETVLQGNFQAEVVLLEKSEDSSTPLITAEFLDSPNLIGAVLRDDVMMSRRNQFCARQLVNFVKKGGSLVIVYGGSGVNKFERHMKNFWGLDWTLGEYRSNTFFLNSSDNELAQSNPSLPEEYSMKAMQVAGIQPDQAVYMQTAESRHPLPEGEATIHAPIARARVGRGFLGYVGDVNREKESYMTIMAMLGLLDRPGEVVNTTGELRVMPGR